MQSTSLEEHKCHLKGREGGIGSKEERNGKSLGQGECRGLDWCEIERWVRWITRVWGREKGLDTWDDKRERVREGGLKLGKIDSARGKCERIN